MSEAETTVVVTSANSGGDRCLLRRQTQVRRALKEQQKASSYVAVRKAS